MLSEKHIMRFWTVMIEVYGKEWYRNYGKSIENGEITSTARTWLGAFNAASLSAMDIKAGLQNLAMREHTFPPSLPEFIALCRPAKPEAPPALWQRAYEADQERKALPPPKAPTPEVSQTLKDATKPGKRGRRCIFSPGYGWDEYRKDLAKAKADGRSAYEVDMEACGRNGWTEADEEHVRAAWLTIPGNSVRTLYPRGHAPEEK